IPIFLNAGDGRLVPGRTLEAGNGTYSVAAGDFNNDGRADLVSSDSVSNDITVFLGQGDGTFRRLPPFSASQRPQSVVVDDFDHDGREDLAVLAGCGDGF